MKSMVNENRNEMTRENKVAFRKRMFLRILWGTILPIIIVVILAYLEDGGIVPKDFGSAEEIMIQVITVTILAAIANLALVLITLIKRMISN